MERQMTTPLAVISFRVIDGVPAALVFLPAAVRCADCRRVTMIVVNTGGRTRCTPCAERKP